MVAPAKNTTRLNFDITIETWQGLKKIATERAVTVTQILRELIDAELTRAQSTESVTPH